MESAHSNCKQIAVLDCARTRKSVLPITTRTGGAARAQLTHFRRSVLRLRPVARNNTERIPSQTNLSPYSASGSWPSPSFYFLVCIAATHCMYLIHAHKSRSAHACPMIHAWGVTAENNSIMILCFFLIIMCNMIIITVQVSLWSLDADCKSR